MFMYLLSKQEPQALQNHLGPFLPCPSPTHTALGLQLRGVFHAQPTPVSVVWFPPESWLYPLAQGGVPPIIWEVGVKTPALTLL